MRPSIAARLIDDVARGARRAGGGARLARATGPTPRICRRSAYQPPAPLASRSPRRLTVLFGEPSLERLAIAVQRQLQAAGIEIELEPVTADEIVHSRSAQAISTRCCRTIFRGRTSSGLTCTGIRTARSTSATTATRRSTTRSIASVTLPTTMCTRPASRRSGGRSSTTRRRCFWRGASAPAR